MRVMSTGNVGIGKIDPTKILQVVGGTSGALTQLLSIWSNCATCGNLNTGTGIKLTNSNGVNEDLGSVELTATRNITGGNADFGVRTSNNTPTMSERLRITGVDGYVGINSSNSAPAVFAPSTALHIRDRNTANNDQLSIEKFSLVAGQVAGIRFRVSDIANVNESYKGAIYFERTNTSGRGTLHFATNDVDLNATNVAPSDARMSIIKSGEVGIGTTAPAQRLHIAGGNVLTDRAYAAITFSVSAGASISIATPATQVRITDNTSTIANGTIAYTATAMEGQYLWITNADAQNTVFASTIIPNGKTVGFVFVNSAWNTVSADNANSTNWSIIGNAGTSAATNFIGTTDSVALFFKVNNHTAGRIGLQAATDFNTSFGNYSLHKVLTTGLRNTAMGALSMQNLTTGDDNTSYGYLALNTTATGNNNTAIGSQALNSNTTSFNTAVGTMAMFTTTNGSQNTSIGYQSMYNNLSGVANTVEGYQALYNNINSSSNVAIGFQALYSHRANNNNTAVGRNALLNDTTGLENTAIGYNSMNQNGYGRRNTAIGVGALQYNEIGDSNVAVGYNALRGATLGGSYNNNNVGLGTASGLNITTGYNNVLVGNNAGRAITSGYDNVFFGNKTGYNNTSGDNNLFYGNTAGFKNTTGRENLFFGNLSGFENITGGFNVFLGRLSGNQNSTGSQNTFVGYVSGRANTTGITNSCFGYYSGGAITTGNENVMLGMLSGLTLSTGSDNTFVGAWADCSVISASNSAAFGANAIVNGSNRQRFGDDNVLRWGFGSNVAAGRAIEVGTSAANGNNAYLTSGGAWTNASDKNKKEYITFLNSKSILEKINQLEITRWKYKGTTEGDEYHIGPMAQDFYNLFNVGIDSTSISTIDPAGVSLIGIQELSKRLSFAEETNVTLQKQLQELQKQNAKLEEKLNTLFNQK
jgi:hypothetical protein